MKTEIQNNAAALRGRTIPQQFLCSTARFAANLALHEKRAGKWHSIIWSEYAEQVKYAALGLAEIGITKGDRVCILSESCPHWLYADMAIMCAGGASVGIYPTSTPEQIKYFIEDCEASFIFVSDQTQLDKLQSIRPQLSRLKKIIVFGDVETETADSENILSFEDLTRTGCQVEKQDKDRFGQLANTVSSDNVAILIYTSGTTGPPKGAMLTHRNIMFETAVHDKFMHMGEGDHLISFLPLSHIAERMLTSIRPMVHGAQVSFSQGRDTLATEIREISPHVFFAVPRIWEKFHEAITGAVEKGPFWRRWPYYMALSIGRRAAKYKYSARKVPALLAGLQKITNPLIMRKIRTMIGMNRAHFVICGAAPVSPDLLLWIAAIGLDVRETYGLTENGSIATASPLNQRKLGSVGKAVLDSEVKIADDGEILIKGDHVFLGYINKEDATRETLNDGWLHTGDLGRFDEDGFLYITGRKKDIIITSGGKNISPALIENELKFHSLISDCMVVGEGRKYLTCLVLLDPANATGYAKSHNLPDLGDKAFDRSSPLYNVVEKEISRVNKQFSRVEQIKRFQIIDASKALDNTVLTPTMKLKRDAFYKKHKSLIDAMYADKKA